MKIFLALSQNEWVSYHTLPLIPSHQGRGKNRETLIKLWERKKTPIKIPPPLVGGGKGEGNLPT
jgi:hypothetical protein